VGDVRLEAKELRRVFGAFPTGVAALAATVDGEPVGLAVSSFTSVSLDPPLASVSVAHSSATWPRLRHLRRLGVTILGAHQEQACRSLSAKTGDRFADLDVRTTGDGALFIEGGSAWLDCSIERIVLAGDHDIVLLRIHDLDADPAVAPLVFHASAFRRIELLPEVTAV
jgi:flavin reductase (DIM6/NTAB) family NADH-FMN oxidoreductase RutF